MSKFKRGDVVRFTKESEHYRDLHFNTDQVNFTVTNGPRRVIDVLTTLGHPVESKETHSEAAADASPELAIEEPEPSLVASGIPPLQ